MIILDTNVVSEAMRPKPNPSVLSWLNKQAADTLYLSSVTVAEMLFGIASIHAGKRKDMLVQVFDGLVGIFMGRILPFDVDAAKYYAKLAVAAKSKGRGFPTPDGYIAAIADSRGFVVASRDTAPFEAVGIPVINPWA